MHLPARRLGSRPPLVHPRTVPYPGSARGEGSPASRRKILPRGLGGPQARGRRAAEQQVLQSLGERDLTRTGHWRRRPQHALKLLDLLANEGGRVGELLRARWRGSEPEGSVGLEAAGEVVEPLAHSGGRSARWIVGGSRLERSRLRGQSLDLSGHDRALGEHVVKRDKAATVEISRLGAPLGRSCAVSMPHHEPDNESSRQCEAEGDPAPGRAARGGLAARGGRRDNQRDGRRLRRRGGLGGRLRRRHRPRGRGPCRCCPCRSGPRHPGLGTERAKAPSAAGPEREACDGQQGKGRRDLHEPAKHLSPVGTPHGESFIPA